MFLFTYIDGVCMYILRMLNFFYLVLHTVCRVCPTNYKHKQHVSGIRNVYFISILNFLNFHNPQSCLTFSDGCIKLSFIDTTISNWIVSSWKNICHWTLIIPYSININCNKNIAVSKIQLFKLFILCILGYIVTSPLFYVVGWSWRFSFKKLKVHPVMTK